MGGHHSNNPSVASGPNSVSGSSFAVVHPASPTTDDNPSRLFPPPFGGFCGGALKGGDPAAPSGTATLLRLRPNRRSHLRQLPPKGLGHWLRVLPTFMT